MKQVHTQQNIVTRRGGYAYDPERHYVLVQKPSDQWEDGALDRLSDEVLADGSPAYRIDADGSAGAEQRRITGHRQLVMISCPKSYIEAKVQASAAESRLSFKRVDDPDAKLEIGSPVSFSEIPNQSRPVSMADLAAES